MTSTLTTELQDGLQAVSQSEGPESGIGLLIEESMNLRLIESASAHLDLKCIILKKDQLSMETLAPLEMIVTDAANIELIQGILAGHEARGDGPNPALISITLSDDCSESQTAQGIHPYDGVLCLPQSPAQLAAQLSLTLYSHRAFARRYHNALEELNLNRRIFRSVTSGISVADATDPNLPLTYVNPAFEAMTGYSLEEVVGKNCRFLQGKDTAQSTIGTLNAAIRERREVVVILKNYRKDGMPFWNELSLSPIRNREGEVTHFVGIQTDVTARVEFEAALRESEKLAAVGRLASSIAHEINNPLESVMNLVYLAAHSDESDETKKYLALADAELQRVKLITAQSLRFFKQSTKPQSVQCSELLNSVLDLYASRLVNAGVTIERKDRRSQPLTCMESEIRQVLNNLVGNAIDAMQSSGGGRLIIRTREATDWQSGQRGVLFTLADTGSGINPEDLASIFRPFFTTKGAHGTGLGLWISSGIVDRHNGRLKVRSRRSASSRSGTVFELFLPFDGQLKPLPEALKTGIS
jgi:PAS domain S-box-containing protein